MNKIITTGIKLTKQYGPKVATVLMGAYSAYSEMKFKQEVETLKKTVSELQKK